MRLSCKEIPVRMWIIVLILTTRILMVSITQITHFCWKHMIETSGQVRYKPWCLLTNQQRTDGALIPWYNGSTPDYDPKYRWTAEHLSYIKEALFYGQMISAVPGGILAEYIGSFYVLLYTTTMAAILNIGRTIITSAHWKMLVVLEFVIGIHIGLVYPAIYIWIARWAPPNERGVFMASQVGTGFGDILTRVFVRYMIRLVSWKWIFYTSTILTLVHLIPLWFLGSNNPEDHKRMSAKELLYIKRSQRGKVTPTRSFPPFGNILCSGAFWPLNILCFGATCAYMFFIFVVANFLYDFMGIKREVVEIIEVFPQIVLCVVAIVAALLGDYVRTKKVMDDTIMIKTTILFSHLGPGCVLLFMGVAYCNQNVAIALLFVGYASSGCSILSTHRTIIDISPNYAGTVYGLLHVSRSLVNIVVPRVSIEILKFNSGIIGWTIIFLIGGGCVVGTGVIFLFFGTTKTQWWNLKSQDIYKLYHYKKPEQMPSLDRGADVAGTSRIQDEQQENAIDIDTEDWKSVKSVNVGGSSQPQKNTTGATDQEEPSDSDSVFESFKEGSIITTTQNNFPDREHEESVDRNDLKISPTSNHPIGSGKILYSSEYLKGFRQLGEQETAKWRSTKLHGTRTDFRLGNSQKLYDTTQNLNYFDRLLQKRSKSSPDLRRIKSFESDVWNMYDGTKLLKPASKKDEKIS